jgi:hypothetical protein
VNGPRWDSHFVDMAPVRMMLPTIDRESWDRSYCYLSERRDRWDWGNSYYDRRDQWNRGIR